MSSTQQEFDFSELPPTALFVLKILELADDPLQQKEIVSRTRLNERTARNAISYLKEEDVIKSIPSLSNPSAMKYTLTDDFEG